MKTLVIPLIVAFSLLAYPQEKGHDTSYIITVIIDTTCGDPFSENEIIPTINAKITKVLSGNEVEASLEDGRIITVRMIGIEAPPIDKPFGLEAKRFLENNALNREVYLTTNDFGATAAIQLRNKYEDLNHSMLRLGLAKYSPPEWHSMYRSTRCKYERASNKAKSQLLGVWSVAP